MFVLRKSPEGDAERSNFDRSPSPASYASATLSSLFILVGGDTDDCLIKEIPAEGFGGRRHAAHALLRTVHLYTPPSAFSTFA
jgi:hypothetical protein